MIIMLYCPIVNPHKPKKALSFLGFALFGVILAATSNLNGQGVISAISYDREPNAVDMYSHVGTSTDPVAGNAFPSLGTVTRVLPTPNGGSFTASYSFVNGSDSALLNISTSYTVINGDVVSENGRNGDNRIDFTLTTPVSFVATTNQFLVTPNSLANVGAFSILSRFTTGDIFNTSVTSPQGITLTGILQPGDYEWVVGSYAGLRFVQGDGPRNGGGFSGNSMASLDFVAIPEPIATTTILGLSIFALVCLRRVRFPLVIESLLWRRN